MSKKKTSKRPGNEKGITPNIALDYNILNKLIVGIGEAAEITGVPQRQLRYWEAKGIIQTCSGANTSTTRRFDYFELKKILLIKELMEEGFTLEAAAKKVEKRMELINSAFIKLLESREDGE